jgi:hypothetical protein
MGHLRPVVLALVLLLVAVPSASADHVWYTWSAQAPFDVTLRSELADPDLQASLERAMVLWSLAPELDFVSSSKGKVMVTVEQRNLGPGSLAYTQPTIRGGKLAHMLVVVNEHYLDYPDPDYAFNLRDEPIRNWLMCHELGHTIGLDHRSEGDGCLYTGWPYQSPDAHDYEMLMELYGR